MNFKTIKISEVKVDATAEQGEFHLPTISKRFLFAKKALFAVTNSKKNVNLLYKVAFRDYLREDNGKSERMAFLQVKQTGGRFPFRYIGWIDMRTGRVNTTKTSEFHPGSIEFDAAQWAIVAVMTQQKIPVESTIEAAGRCGRCAQVLQEDTKGLDSLCVECDKLVSKED